jgi:gamma-glutamyltranspeptidase/glutathione hydrolase
MRQQYQRFLLLSLFTVSVLSACGGPVPRAWSMRGRAESVAGPRAMVVSGHPIASEVGLRILRGGGNAVDAAVAVGFALAVVHPAAGNIGGGGFMVFRFADGTTAALDYREIAPAAATPDMYLDSLGGVTTASVEGHLASGVPGSVAGLAEAHARYGRLPWADVVRPAINLAVDGFAVDEARHRSIASAAGRLRQFEASRRQFLVNDSAPPVGHVLRQTELALTLATIARDGPDAFYRGWIADSMVAEMRRGGGLITHADLATYRALWRDPVVFTYRGHTIYSMPPSSSGGVTLALMLNMLEGWDSLPPFGSPEQLHRLSEVMARAFVDRNQYLGDPAFINNPVTTLTSQEYADRRRATITDRHTPSAEVVPGLVEGEHTTHYSVVDAQGNAVAVTTTINDSYGSAVTVTGAGFLLNDEMDDFTSAPGRPNMYGLIQGEANAIRGHKRMLSAMTPTIITDRQGRTMLILGSPGGPTIITTLTQVISNVIDHGMTLAEAIEAPRVHHQHLPDSLRYEPNGFSRSVMRRLAALGHTPAMRRDISGEVSAIGRGTSGWVGVADPRRGGGAAGY